MYDEDTIKLSTLTLKEQPFTLFEDDEPALSPTEPLIDLNGWMGWYGEELAKLKVT